MQALDPHQLAVILYGVVALTFIVYLHQPGKDLWVVLTGLVWPLSVVVAAYYIHTNARCREAWKRLKDEW